MFCEGLEVLVSHFLSLSDMTPFTRVSRITGVLPITAAQVLHAPIHVAVRTLDNIIPLDILAATLIPHRPHDGNLVAVCNLQAHLMARRLGTARARGIPLAEDSPQNCKFA